MIGGTPQERKERWQLHFQTLLNVHRPNQDPCQAEFNPTPVSDLLPISTDQFSPEEFNSAFQELKYKAPGNDEIPAEFFKSRIASAQLLNTMNLVFETRTAPREWTKSVIIPIPKQGDLTDPANFRGISLTSLAAKTYNHILINRVKPHVDPLLRKNQNGFRQGRGTLEQILCLRRLIEGAQRGDRRLISIFVDFKKAFDSIDRTRMFAILTAYGITPKVVAALKSLYHETQAFVRTSDGITDFFEITTGVLQGDTAAPYLFIIVLDYALRIAFHNPKLGFEVQPRKSSRHPAIHVTDLDFADDLAIVTEDVQHAQELLRALEDAAAEVGLIINCKKTKVLACGKIPPFSITLRDDSPIEHVPDFKYLGSWIRTSDKDISIRKALATKACKNLSRVWKSPLSTEHRLRLFRAMVEPVLLYGCETWTVNQEMLDRLNGCYTRLLRIAHNVDWTAHARNSFLYGNGTIPPLAHTIAKRTLRFAGHAFRAKDQLVPDIMMFEPRPTASKLSYLKTLCHLTGATKEELPGLMSDRDNWKVMVARSTMSAR